MISFILLAFAFFGHVLEDRLRIETERLAQLTFKLLAESCCQPKVTKSANLKGSWTAVQKNLV